jgi:zinc/manganese transport system ATP-binding protein/zinc transport system ATP-binding protein
VTVEQVVLMGRRSGRGWPWPSREDRHAVAALLERLGIAALARRHIRDLSGGQQQRVFLARALVSQPRLLLLDEPTSGVDVKTRHDILHLLEELNGEGITIVLTTHDLNAVAAHLPWVVCLNGHLIAEGPPIEVLTSDVLRRTYGAEMTVLRHEGHLLIVDASTLRGLHEPISSVVWDAR